MVDVWEIVRKSIARVNATVEAKAISKETEFPTAIAFDSDGNWYVLKLEEISP